MEDRTLFSEIVEVKQRYILYLKCYKPTVKLGRDSVASSYAVSKQKISSQSGIGKCRSSHVEFHMEQIKILIFLWSMELIAMKSYK